MLCRVASSGDSMHASTMTFAPAARAAAQLAVIGLALIAVPALAQDLDAGAPAHARVSFLEGTASRVVEDAGAPLAQGEDLSEGDRLITGADGRVEVMFPEGTLIRMGPSSELLITELGFKADTSTLSARIRLAVGAVWSHVVKLPAEGKFEVETD